MQAVVSQTQSNRSGCFAVKVRSRAEPTVSDTLRRKGYDVLLPTYTARQRYSDRIKVTSNALFPGYVFVRLNPAELLGVVSTDGVSYVVKSGNTFCPLPPEEECLLEALATTDAPCAPGDFFHQGQRIEIRSGPFKNQKATLVRVDNKDRLVLSLNSILSAVTVELRNTDVVPCDA